MRWENECGFYFCSSIKDRRYGLGAKSLWELRSGLSRGETGHVQLLKDAFRPRYRLDCVSLRQPADGSRSAGDAFRTLSTGKEADVGAVESCLKICERPNGEQRLSYESNLIQRLYSKKHSDNLVVIL